VELLAKGADVEAKDNVSIAHAWALCPSLSLTHAQYASIPVGDVSLYLSCHLKIGKVKIIVLKVSLFFFLLFVCVFFASYTLSYNCLFLTKFVYVFTLDLIFILHL
jgi:hypothetical protein